MNVRVVGGHGGVAYGLNATSYVINNHLLIDAGSVASGLTIEEQLKIDQIFLSHAHLDHTKDLAFLADNCFGLRPDPFLVMANDHVISAIREHLLNDVLWPDFSKLPSAALPTVKFISIRPEETKYYADCQILPIRVNHPGEAMGFVVSQGEDAVLFTLDTGSTDRIWDVAHQLGCRLKGIFTEVSFPNRLQRIADLSFHHTPNSMREEIKKMPPNVPIFLGHLKPNYQAEVIKEIAALKNERITVMESDSHTYVF